MTDRPRGEHLPARPERVGVPTYPTAPPTYFVTEDPGDTGPLGIGAFLRRRMWTLLGALAVVVPLTAYFTSTRPTIYESYSSFLIEAGEGGEGAPLEVLQLTGRSGTMLTETSLMQSRRVVAPAARTLGRNLSVVVDEESRPIASVCPSFSVSEEVVPGTYRIEPGRWSRRKG